MVFLEGRRLVFAGFGVAEECEALATSSGLPAEAAYAALDDSGEDGVMVWFNWSIDLLETIVTEVLVCLVEGNAW